MAERINRFMQRFANWLEQRASLAQPWQCCRFVALDLETTGLQVKQHEVLAVAWVNIQPPIMDYGSAQYHLFNQVLVNHTVVDKTVTAPDNSTAAGQSLANDGQTGLGQSPVIHGLTQADFMQSSDPIQTLRMLSRALNDAILVCHNAQLDWRFLQQLSRRYQVKLKPLAIFDTLNFEARRLRQQQQVLTRDSLTLAACRAHYHLPRYTGHHALTDAIACGELLLAQAYAYSRQQRVSARELLKHAR
ncbi:3'-5' exonuclease [Idiomarina xiamenensis]|uniref:3'-5' exonuclease n=1 Tax=Idiomarina xiamenensis 10-D-4 TaxID=740709 RepID=K2K3A1_9GAMM|nr:3'-5' exonuclease [Idiomarina xiamenensis]EKE82093.1 3'-5' exonuclease [Idiomarina xiamenensis 10-D-4]